MGVQQYKVGTGAHNVTMPDGLNYNDGDVIELAVQTALAVGARRPIAINADHEAAYAAAVARLVTAGTLVNRGKLSVISGFDDAPSGALVQWTYPLTLANVANGEVVRFEPGFAGSILSFTFLTLVPVTTAAKAATLGLTSTFPAAEVQLLTLTGSPTGGSFVPKPFGVADTAAWLYNDTVSAAQAKVDAVAALVGKVVVGGSAGAWTVKAAGSLAGADQPNTTITTNSLTGGSSPAVSISTTVIGGSNSVVGGPSALALTSAAATPAGMVIPASSTTGGNTFVNENEIIVTASSVTAFVEGSGYLRIVMQAA